MRTRLHPEMGNIVIAARVARQLTLVQYKRHMADDLTPSQCAALAAFHLPSDYPGVLRFALHSLAVYLDLGMTSGVWLATALQAVADGHSFRRCFFFDYKANRSPYPRVTNRGVQNSLEALPRRTKKGRINA